MSDPIGAVAVIGMAGRFPGAADVERFWENLRAGVHSITFFDAEEGDTDPAHVRAVGVLEGIDRFDAAFFGFSPRDAEMLDPQQRMFLEAAWEALENAGHVPGSEQEAVAVYAGASGSRYLAQHLLSRPDVVESVGHFALELLNERTFLASRASYKLDLRGAAVNVQTACSTGLAAIHLACQALAAGECDLAVAGGVGLSLQRGHRYAPGGIMSPDGYCRAFDTRAAGTVGGSGLGVVVLRRLEDALADGDPVRAVILGSAMNNDGAQKVGFTAPSVEGQAEVVEEALALAGVDPETMGYVEAHGSGTELGDPVEVAALTRAFGEVGRTGYCALGSVKTNVGHLDAAAGVAGFVKAVLALEHGEIPPSLHFTEPNPQIDFAGSPFFVNTGLVPFPGGGALPRRAGVSSLGIGGTNVHVVLEEAPPRAPSAPARAWHVLPLSARTPAALEAATDRLAAHLRAHPEQELADVAWTLQTGRKSFAHRRTLVARDGEGAARALEQRAPGQLFDAAPPEGGQPVTFVFPGLGNHYPGMGKGLYETEPLFRETVDRCAEILRPWLGMDLREALYPADEPAPADGAPAGLDLRALLGRAGRDDDMGLLDSTRLAQPALFVTEYALARLWLSWGVRPEAMIGHSLGEYVAATVAGVWSLEDALMLVAERARLIEETPPGGMMGLPFPKEKAAPYLRDGLAIGAHNAWWISVVSGPKAAVDALQAEMTASGVSVRRLPAKHAYHSPMMEPVAERLAELLRGVRLSPPTIPFASNVTGGWIRPEEATDPEYWTRHLVQTVLFSDGVETIARDGFRLLLEVGPGNTVGGLALQVDCWGDTPATLVVALRHRFESHPDDAYLLGAAGRLWAAGASVDWEAVHAHERLRRVALPTYPFERERYWVEPGSGAAPGGRGGAAAERRSGPAGWMYLPAWRRSPLPAQPLAEPAEWLVLADGVGIGGRLAGRLESLGHTVAVAEAGDGFARSGDRGYTVRPGSAEDLAALRDALQGAGVRPRRVIVLWGIDPEGGEGPEAFARAHARGYATVAALAATFAREASEGPFRLLVATEGVRDVAGGEDVRPERATVLGACLTLPQELAHVVCRTVDVRPGAPGDERLVEQLLAEADADAADTTVALRGPRRWVLRYEAAPADAGAASLRPGGAYLVSGGMPAGTGVLAEHLAGVGARLAVVVPPSFPEREAWDAVLASPGGGGAAGQTLRGIMAAEARGCTPLVLRADPRDAVALRGAVAAAVEAFGALHGVVHATQGGGGEPGPLAEARSAAAGLELARLTRELAALEEATAGLPLDFLLLQNSIFSVFGGSGLAATTAAFVLGDAWAERCAAQGRRWTSVSWDRWEEEGSSAAMAAGAIPRAEGVRVFETLAALAGEPRVVVSPQDLHARLERFRTPRRTASAPAEGGQAAPQEGLHARPSLATEYLEPTGEAEELVAGIFRELLGIREVGTRDSFFELGGHSLLGLQVLGRVREVFQVDLPLRAIFEAPTVAGLAELVDAAILLELEEMSDEEAESALAGVGGALDAVTEGVR
ncbi:type I polyketide synthase [Longimicrobium sp.]|jgi:acyl transferase domain-containing protein/acyl carrier protein|uniref:type I polyketide synthase n=1 Tax=Longimicrobium sp. TaxID=2029185 RepID=UPI002EDB4403